jgi:hypothetical protein
VVSRMNHHIRHGVEKNKHNPKIKIMLLFAGGIGRWSQEICHYHDCLLHKEMVLYPEVKRKNQRAHLALR